MKVTIGNYCNLKKNNKKDKWINIQEKIQENPGIIKVIAISIS